MPDRHPVIADGVDRAVAAGRVRKLAQDFSNLPSWGTGPQSGASHEMRRRFLTLVDEAERVLEQMLVGDDFALALQTPRYVSLLEGRVTNDQLYRTIAAEQRRWLRALEELLTELERSPRLPEETGSPIGTIAPSALIPPKAFISHASKDKDRFVLGFAASLLAQGVNSWVDKWELQPGSSLPKEIFDGGIDDCDVFIIVLSEYSIDSKWVQEELDAGVVLAIEGRCKLIPVVLDGVEIPQPLRHRKYVVIQDPSDYDKELDEIVRGIFNVSSKPGLGPPPGYVEPSIEVPGLLPTDNTVLGLAAEQAFASWSPPWNLDVNALQAATGRLGIGDDGFSEAMEALGRAGLLKLHRMLGGALRASITLPGLIAYASAKRPDFRAIRRAVIAALLNAEGPPPPLEGPEIAEAVDAPTWLAELVLEELKAKNLIGMSRGLGNLVRINQVSPALRRELDN
ncbi:toll/interleukin-1 receptor domain-containing protein [Frankia sp. CiP3]|uniref:toll/interleukin-1 receptor domain-containing protein n=1 Tax=Frankia sp. CiP3 TaxID=2880971 RepID=UPI001EF45D83|nr:toll/interleukin-1 receptor domain-containing protein [Frankia sp. CiP3]